MDTIVCKNIFLSNEETEREQAFNEVWQRKNVKLTKI